MNDCVVCASLQGANRELWIHEDELVLLGHVGPTPGQADGYLGQLLLVPKRHATSPSALTAEEARHIGLWLSLGCRLLEESQGAEHVYMQRLGDGWAHLHLHLVPRYPGTPKEFHGVNVRNWEGAPKGDWAQAAAVAAKLREAAASLRA